MRRIIVSEFVTLDGVMEDPGGAEKFERGGWAFQFKRGPAGDQFKLEETMVGATCLAEVADLPAAGFEARGLRAVD